MEMEDLEKLPKSITKDVFVTMRISGYSVGEIQCWDCDIANGNEEFLHLTSKKVTFNLPQNMDVKGKIIEGLEEEKEKIQADAHMRIKDIQHKIDSLIAIEYKPL